MRTSVRRTCVRLGAATTSSGVESALSALGCDAPGAPCNLGSPGASCNPESLATLNLQMRLATSDAPWHISAPYSEVRVHLSHCQCMTYELFDSRRIRHLSSLSPSGALDPIFSIFWWYHEHSPASCRAWNELPSWHRSVAPSECAYRRCIRIFLNGEALACRYHQP